MKHRAINPHSLAELKKKVPVIGRTEIVKTGYILDINGSGEAELFRYENSQEVISERCDLGVLMYESFDDFMKQVREYIGRKKLYISIDYALVILAVLNGEMPEDYDEE